MNKHLLPAVLTSCFLLSTPLHAAGELGHNEKKVEDRVAEGQPTAAALDADGDEHAEGNSITLDEGQRQEAGIVVKTINAQTVATEIKAPGEIQINRYTTRQITPRIEAQVVERHALMGDTVKAGQRLITLSSVAMSEAQGEFLVAENEWKRVKRLGRKVVSDRRFQDTQIVTQKARARLLAYGMTQVQIKALLEGNKIEQANGRFELLAPIDGTVINDEFIVGQMAQPGDVLFEISDESRLWVEARLDPKSAARIKVEDAARVQVGEDWIEGKVTQIHHVIDETTRTLAIRIEIPNPDDRLHSGRFVTAAIQVGESEQVGLVVPLEAVLRSADGDWQVFVEHQPGEFEPKEVEVVKQFSGRLLVEGIKPGSRVVTHGAFFVQSELAKSGFAVHNH